MADNTPFQASTDPAQPKIADKEVTHSGDLAKVQLIALAEVTGTEGAYTLREYVALDTLIQRLLTLQAAATTTDVPSGTGDVQAVAATPSLRLLGFTSRESAASPAEAEFTIRHGTSAAGTPLAYVNLGPNESTRDWFGPGGMIAANGIFIDRVSGTTEISIHTVIAP